MMSCALCNVTSRLSRGNFQLARKTHADGMGFPRAARPTLTFSTIGEKVFAGARDLSGSRESQSVERQALYSVALARHDVQIAQRLLPCNAKEAGCHARTAVWQVLTRREAVGSANRQSAGPFQARRRNWREANDAPTKARRRLTPVIVEVK
jgi:hypothetical protein